MRVTIEEARTVAARSRPKEQPPDRPCAVVVGLARNTPEGHHITCRTCGAWVVHDGQLVRP